MVPLDSNAVRSNTDDRLSILETRWHQMELGSEQYLQIPTRCPLDPCRIRRALQHHYHLLARIFGDEHRHDIRCVSRTDRCAFIPFLLRPFCSSLRVMLNGVGCVLGIGPNADHCTGRAERLASGSGSHTCEGIHPRLGPTAIPRTV